MRRIGLGVLSLAIVTACQPATTELTEERRAAVADTVRQLADAFFEDFRAIDFEGAIAPFSSEIVWAENGVLGANRDSLMGAWRAVFGSMREVTSGDWKQVHVTVLGPSAAVFNASFDWAGIDTAGAAIGGSGVWTAVWEKTAEGWQIVQGHESYLPPPESM